MPSRLRRSLHAPIPSATARNGELPLELDAVLVKALAKDRAHRQASALLFMQELTAALVARQSLVFESGQVPMMKAVAGSSTTRHTRGGRSAVAAAVAAGRPAAEAALTTPRLPIPPTMTGLPRRSGRSRCSTAA